MPIDLAGWITFLVGASVSVLLEWSPAVSTWFVGLTGMQKRAVILGLALLAALSAFAVSCGGLFQYVSCDQSGAYLALGAAIQFFLGSQTAYVAMPKNYDKYPFPFGDPPGHDEGTGAGPGTIK